MPSIAAAAVSVIIPVHGNFALTRDCLKSLSRTSRPALEVIVVDNGSDDETPQRLPELGAALFGAGFRHIRFEENRNFAPACNAGAKAARGDFVFFLNNDTILTRDWLPPLLHRFRNVPRLGAAGPLLTYPDATVQHLGVTVCPGCKVAHLYKSLPADHPLSHKRRFFQALTAAALLMPRRLFLSCGGFDEGFINGFEDVDLGLRLSARDFRLACVPESRVIHLESKTPNRFRHENDNGPRLLRKWRLDRLVDFPDLVRADGYSLAVLPQLELRLTTSAAVSADFLSRLRPFDPARCFELLRREPLWEEGYQLLGEHLESVGEHASALELYSRAVACKNAPSLADCERIRRVQEALDMDTSAIRAAREQIMAEMRGEAYARKRERILQTLADGSPAQQELIPRYERAYAEGLRLAAQSLPDAATCRKKTELSRAPASRKSRRRR